MNPLLGLRTLALLALVAASTIVIVRPDLVSGAARAAHAPHAPLVAPVITNLLVAGVAATPPPPLQKHPDMHHGKT